MPRNEQDPSSVGSNLDIRRLQIMEDRELKVKIGELLKTLERGTKSRERSIAITKLQEAESWLVRDIDEAAKADPGAVPR